MEKFELNKSNETKSLFVSILGKPNVGKSSLMNMLVNSKVSIVSPKPQTTRNKILGILTNGNIQLVFIDTPGIHKTKNKLDKYMISEVNNSLCGAEACMHVVEAGKKVTDFDLDLIKKVEKLNIPVILVINKIDLLSDKSLLAEQIQEFSKIFEYSSVVPVSSKTCDGREDLICELENSAQPSVFFFSENDVTDQTERTLVREIIREKLLKFLDHELPHGIAVVTESFKTKENGITDISAVVYCEKENHKGIIIGKSGNMLKKIGSLARIDLEQMLGRKINLKIWVKTKENWRNSDFLLNDFGYGVDDRLK